MAVINTIFSTLGNNASRWTIATKDGIETAGRVTMAYKEGAKTSKEFGKLDAREKLIEANATSLVWLGGIPTLKILYDKLKTNKQYGFKQFKDYGKDALANTDIRLLEENAPQALKLANIKNEALKAEVQKILSNPKAFKNNFLMRAIITTLIPIALVGYILPKTVYAFTHKMVERKKKQEIKNAYSNQQHNQEHIIKSTPTFASFMGKAKNNNLAFNGKVLNSLSECFMNPTSNMKLVDLGVWAGRAGSSRNLYEAAERSISELGYIFLLYKGGKYVDKALQAILQKGFKVPTALDAKLLQDKSFMNELVELAKDKNLTESALKFVERNESQIISHLDNDLAKNAGKFSDITLKAAQKAGIVDVVEGARNPLKYIDTEKIGELNTQLKEFVNTLATNKNASALVNKAKWLKRGSIVASIAICSAALAYGLPKVQYLFRKLVSKNNSTIAPGLTDYYNRDNNAKKA